MLDSGLACGCARIEDCIRRRARKERARPRGGPNRHPDGRAHRRSESANQGNVQDSLGSGAPSIGQTASGRQTDSHHIARRARHTNQRASRNRPRIAHDGSHARQRQ
jgi:hypothetical protein